MSKRTSFIAVVLLIAAAILLGLVLVNRGDGPVAGLIVSDKSIVSVQEYNNVKAAPANGVYMVFDNEFNKFKEKIKVDIPESKDLFAGFHFVECKKGMQFTVRWIKDGNIVKEETKELLADREGIISYPLEGSKVKSGSYKLELYGEKRLIHDFLFIIK